MMKAKILKTVLILALTLMTGLSAIGATTVFQTITGTLRPDITVNLDGNVLDLKDANGATITPISVDDSTYLPIRAIANSTGLDVVWDENTQTVNLIQKRIGIRGTVKSIENGKDGITMLVEGTLEKDTQFDRASVTVNRDSIVTIEGIQTLVALNYSEIKLGDRVEVIFKGAVSKSVPVMGVAASVQIMSEK